jgi:hypothetical protein
VDLGSFRLGSPADLGVAHLEPMLHLLGVVVRCSRAGFWGVKLQPLSQRPVVISDTRTRNRSFTRAATACRVNRKRGA